MLTNFNVNPIDYAENLLVHFRRVEDLRRVVSEYPSLDLNKRQICDLELLLNRAYYPLKGYMGREDYESVLDNMRLADGAVWPMPITLDVSLKQAGALVVGEPLALRDEEGFLLAVLNIREIWQPDKRREAEAVFGADDPDKHPGVRYLYEKVGDWYISGILEGIHLPIHYDFKELRLAPADTHRKFAENGWRKVIGFHTEKHLHCAHKEMTLRAAREAGASIFMHPVVGPAHPGDVEYYTQVRCYKAIVEKYPRNMIMLGLIPLAMRKAGPREALWQAIIRRNYGCTHFMTAEDQGDPFANNGRRFYPLGAAQDLVRQFEDETGIQMVPLEKMVYAEDKADYVPASETTEDMNVKEISSSDLKFRLELGLDIPEWFSYPEVVEELRHTYPPRHKQGFTIFLTGLSGSGKSTIAKGLMAKFLEMRDRPVTLLDGDVVRKNLSSELTFSKEHRNLNITRIGFVASEITKNRGIAICAPIAPYEESRRQVRDLIGQYGGYIEVHVCTPLETCERRDRKGIYEKARKGTIKGVTGIDDPYEAPISPNIRIDTKERSSEEAIQEIMLFLEQQGYVR